MTCSLLALFIFILQRVNGMTEIDSNTFGKYSTPTKSLSVVFSRDISDCNYQLFLQEVIE